MKRQHTFFACLPILSLAVTLTGCGRSDDSARGVDHGETLLSVSATGHAETRPDKAQFQAGIQTWAKSAKDASTANAEQIDRIVAALAAQGIAEKDIQTRAVNVGKVDWGDKKGQYQAYNTVNVTVRNVDKAGAAVSAATDAGANIVSGPDLSMTDPEATANIAYGNAYKAAYTRAEAYAKAANMKISRVLYIRDAGGQQGQTWLPAADAMNVSLAPPPPPPVVAPQARSGARIMPGQTNSDVAIQVDFALTAQ